MIIGNGLIANAFDNTYWNESQVIIFASGVSNSKETLISEFSREENMLLDAVKLNQKVVYFSTCSVNDPDLQFSPYVLHKKKMEEIVNGCKDFLIIRLPQVVGVTSNPNTIVNYLYSKIASGASFDLWRYAKRNFIDIQDMQSIASYLIGNLSMNKVTLNIACPFSISILDLVSILEDLFQKKAFFKTVNFGSDYVIDTSVSDACASKLGIDFDDNYVKNVIYKYYLHKVG
jgi:nucleoside-diphosphate-sugar epimerase